MIGDLVKFSVHHQPYRIIERCEITASPPNLEGESLPDCGRIAVLGDKGGLADLLQLFPGKGIFAAQGLAFVELDTMGFLIEFASRMTAKVDLDIVVIG